MSNQYRVLITDRAWPDCEVERRILEPIGVEIVDAPAGDEATLCALASDVDAIATCWAQVTESVIRAAPRCRIVARFGIGLDNIAVAVASELGIPVTYVPDYCVEEVADHTLALLLASARKIAFFHERTKAGEYDLQAGPRLRRLSGQTRGLLGLGRIGRAVFRKATAIGINVLASTPSGDDYGSGCPMVSFADLLDASDFVSLHLPAGPQTRIMGAAEFKRMKRSAYLINTSRGTLVDHTALWSAIQAEELAGAALDVFDPEPPDLSAPLFSDSRVILTPHAGFLSEESLVELRTRTATQVAQVLQGMRPENVVNPQVYQN